MVGIVVKEKFNIMKNKIALVWPAFKNLSCLDATWIPHGIGQLATEIISKGVADVEIIDCRKMTLDDAKVKLESAGVTHIGISVISVYKDNALELLKWIKENRVEIITIVGGMHPTLFPETFKDLANYVIQGEGEVILPQILAEDPKFKAGVHKTEPVDLDSLEIIDRSLFKTLEMPINGGLPEPFATIIIGRGCPYQCTFCQPAEKTLFGNRVRMRGVDHVMKEIEMLKVNSFYIHDDCFIAFPKYVEEFCRRIKPMNLKWWCQGRADLIVNNMSTVKRMRDAGLMGMIIGHESGSDAVLQSLSKGTTVAQNIESTLFLKALGLNVWSNIMIGLPDEKPSDVLKTIEMILKMRPTSASICVFTPHPGSYLYQECKERKIMPENPDQDYYNRGAFEKKIEGPDYEFLRWAYNQMNEIVFGKQG